MIGCPAIERVPVRAGPVLAATANATLPLPVTLPDAGLVIVIQLAFDEAVHAHALSVVIVADPFPPASGNDVTEAVTEYAQGAACVTVNVCPPIVSVPVRAAPLFAATVNETVVLPLPDVLLEMLIQSAFDFAVHVQPPFVASATLPFPPAAANDALDGAIA